MRLPGQLAAAIEVLADIETRHRPVSETLKDWGLAHRFAGAGDRAAIGNLVYDALRRKSSLAWRMGGDTPWHLTLAVAIFEWNHAPEALNAAFADDRHAPPPLPDALIQEVHARDLSSAPAHVRADLPEWLVPHFESAFGEDWVEEAAALSGRPPLDLRVNTLKAEREKVARQLFRFGVVPTRYSTVGLRISPIEGVRRHPNVQAEEAFQRGRFEVQDEGSQLVALLTGAKPGGQVLDIAAGAGGKTLALAAEMQNRGQLYAYDGDRNRLAPIYDRLKRAGVRNVQVRAPGPHALDGLASQMDHVLVDAPCTGAGVWRRRPDAKWRLTPEALAKRITEQDAILAEAAPLVKPGGVLAYATCSLLRPENSQRIAVFTASHPDFRPLPMVEAWSSRLPTVPLPSGALAEAALLLSPRRSETDGFFLSLLRRAG